MTARQDEYVRTYAARQAEGWVEAKQTERIRRAALLIVRHAKTHDTPPTPESTGLPEGHGLLMLAQKMHGAEKPNGGRRRGAGRKPLTVPTVPVQQIRIPVPWDEEIKRRGGLRQVLKLALQIDAPQAAEKN
jgi:hypothetical protein